MDTVIGVNDPQAVKKWSDALGVAVNKAGYFTSRFVGMGSETTMPIQRVDSLESEPGDEITFDLLMPAKMEPVVGDDTLDGKEEDMVYYTDRMRIDQVRGGQNLGGRMTAKRTLRDLRKDAKGRSTDWWARLHDELYFIYLSGSRGTQGGFIWSANNPFFNVNALTAPDAMHQMYGGTATSKATVTAADTMLLPIIDKAVAKAETMGGDTTDELSMIPVNVEGENRYVCVMHTYQFHTLKASTATGQWLDIQKAASAAQGQKNPIFQGGEGMYHNVVLHKHRNVIGFSDYGAGTNLPARRALFLGRQAAQISYGQKGGQKMRIGWTEEVKDHGNKVAIGTYSIFGVKKTTYKSKDNSIVRDFGVTAIDTYAIDPNI